MRCKRGWCLEEKGDEYQNGWYLEKEGGEGGAIGAGQLQAVMPRGVLGLWVDAHHTISIAFHQVQVLL